MKIKNFPPNKPKNEKMKNHKKFFVDQIALMIKSVGRSVDRLTVYYEWRGFCLVYDVITFKNLFLPIDDDDGGGVPNNKQKTKEEKPKQNEFCGKWIFWAKYSS